MDRGRSFRILGLNETATKAQVKRAYGKMIARYKGPDYAEEPEYVERKLILLHQAYQEAYSLAESEPDTYEQTRSTRTARDAEEPEQRRTAKLKKAKASFAGPREDDGHNAREKFHQWMERRDDDKHERKTKRAGKMELPKLTKPDFSKLKELDFSKIKEKINEVLPENELFQDEEEPGVEMGGMLTDDGRDGGEVYTPSSQDSKKDEKIGSIISLVVALIIFAIGACDGSSEPDYSYEEEDLSAYTYIYDEDWELATEEDDRIAELANQSYELLLDNGENGSATTYDEKQSAYQEEAQRFVKNYFGTDLVKDTTAALNEQFPSFAVTEDTPMSEQLDAIFAFYGFAPLSSAIWYTNPYTGGFIEGYGDYLEYLNQFYEAQ